MPDAPLIAHVIHRLDYGGLENGLINLVNHLPHERYRHAIVCLAGYSDFRARIQRPDVEVLSIDKQPGKDPAAYVRLWQTFRRLRPSIVHSRNLGTVDTQWVATVAGVRHRIHGEHGWEAGDPNGLSRRAIRIRRGSAPAIHRFIAVSRDIASWLTDKVGVGSARITQIYNGVDTGRFHPHGAVAGDAPWESTRDGIRVVIGTVSRLDPVKNHLMLIEAFRRLVPTLSPSGIDARLMIVGDGPMRRQIESCARDAGLADRIWLAGSRNDVPELMRAMDIFVLPSLNEGISNTLLEAMATGLPIVASRVGGNPEIAGTAQCGVLYEPNETAALVTGLECLVTDRPRRVEAGRAARARVAEQFSLESMVRGYAAAYDAVLAS